MAHIAILSILLLLLTFGNTINAGITRHRDQLLPNNERITRSTHSRVEDDGKSLETIPVEDAYTKHRRLDRPVRSANGNDLDAAENSVVFRPLFRKKSHGRVRRAATDDLAPAENNVVFKPLFRRKPDRRVRSLDNESQYAAYHEYEKVADDGDSNSAGEAKASDDAINAEETRVKREVSQNGGELMDTAANTIVFRPLFRNNRRYVNRQRN